MWKIFDPANTNDLIDDNDYLVSWKTYREWVTPHKAFWCKEDNSFICLDKCVSVPIAVKAYMLMPRVPEDFNNQMSENS